jgi:transposase
MPCQDTWLESDRDYEIQHEIRVERVKKLTGYLARQLGLIHTPLHDHQENTRFLCSNIKKMNQRQLDTIVYDGLNKMARDLADWWEEHQEMDREREKEQQEKARERELRKTALAKLTDEERKILRV